MTLWLRWLIRGITVLGNMRRTPHLPLTAGLNKRSVIPSLPPPSKCNWLWHMCQLFREAKCRHVPSVGMCPGNGHHLPSPQGPGKGSGDVSKSQSTIFLPPCSVHLVRWWCFYTQQVAQRPRCCNYSAMFQLPSTAVLCTIATHIGLFQKHSSQAPELWKYHCCLLATYPQLSSSGSTEQTATLTHLGHSEKHGRFPAGLWQLLMCGRTGQGEDAKENVKLSAGYSCFLDQNGASFLPL